MLGCTQLIGVICRRELLTPCREIGGRETNNGQIEEHRIVAVVPAAPSLCPLGYPTILTHPKSQETKCRKVQNFAQVGRCQKITSIFECAVCWFELEFQISHVLCIPML